jgi:hypothetical protein
MDLDGVADELYGLPPEDFIAARTEREKQARAAGDRGLAADIRRLGKPTTVAWLANTLVRARRTEIEPLLELGAGLRAASTTLDGDLLRELDRQQHRIVHVLVQQARRLATDTGRPVSEDTARGLESTLHAALADEAAADALAQGRLTDALHRASGFPPAGAAPRLTSVPTGRAARTEAALRTAAAKSTRAGHDEAAAAAAAQKAETERRAAELELARRAEQRAQATARDTAEARDRARSVADRAAAAVRDTAATVDRLRAEFDAATAELSRLEHENTVSRASHETAIQEAQKASQRLEEATEHRQHLAR